MAVLQPTTNNLSTTFFIIIFWLYCAYDLCVCDVFGCLFCQGRVRVGVWEGLGWWEFVLFDFRINICNVQFLIWALKIDKPKSFLVLSDLLSH